MSSLMLDLGTSGAEMVRKTQLRAESVVEER
jgi:hypothetical protein